MSPIISAIFDFNHPTNLIAFVILLILTVLAVGGTLSTRSERLSKYAKQSPAILATVGIFFSFWGISIGLIGLDLKDIQHSIPNLLDGLKIKFIASLMGIAFSIIVRIVQSFTLENKNLANRDSDQIIIDLLIDIRQSLAENNKNNSEQLLKEIKNSLAGDGEASVTTQLAKIRIEIRDSFDNQNKVLYENFNKLIEKFDRFAESMIKNNQEALIEALKDVMRDFNTKINEQFGDNFKQLNEAVGKLLIWQENYKIHVEKLTANFEVALISIETIKTSFSEIEARSQSFGVTSEKLQVVLLGLDSQLKDLSNHLQAFDTLADNAINAFPIIEGNLIKLTTGFKSSSEESLADINKTVKYVSNQFDGMATNIEQVIDTQGRTLTSVSDKFKITVDSTLNELVEQSKLHIKNYETELKTAVNNQMNNINSAITTSSKEFDKLLIERSNSSKQRIEDLDTALQEELKKSIGTMGRLLSSLSEKFVADYSPLTDKLRELVKMAENLKTGRN